MSVVPEFKTLTHSEVMSNIITSEISLINAELLCSEDVEESQKVIYDVLTKVMVNRQEQEVHLLFDLIIVLMTHDLIPMLQLRLKLKER